MTDRRTLWIAAAAVGLALGAGSPRPARGSAEAVATGNTFKVTFKHSPVIAVKEVRVAGSWNS